MKNKNKLFVSLLVTLCFISGCSSPSKPDKLDKMADQVEQALPSEYEKQFKTEVYQFTFEGPNNSTLEYNLCVTTYFAADPSTVPSLNTDAFSAVFDVEKTPLIKKFDAYGHSAAIYQGETRNYACCTTSPETSVVMEYDPNVISEKDIMRSIRSIYGPTVAEEP